MTPTRAWQTVEDIQNVGRRVVSYVEIDVANGLEKNLFDFRYVSFAASQSNALMIDVAGGKAHFGPQAPHMRGVLTLCRADAPSHFSERYPGFALPTYRGATLLSADTAEAALIMHGVEKGYIQIEDKRPVVVGDGMQIQDNQLITTVLDNLWRDDRLLYYPAGKTDFRVNTPPADTIDLVVPTSKRAGYLSQEVTKLGAKVAFDAGYFVWVEEEFNDPYSFANDPIGLVVVDGRVLNAPLYKRAALVLTRHVYHRSSDETSYSLGGIRPLIRSVSLARYAVHLANTITVYGPEFRPSQLPFYFGPNPPKSSIPAELNPPVVPDGHAAFYNRLIGLVHGNTTASSTPSARGRIEFTVVGEHVCAIKEGGESFIPNNGFVLSLPCSRDTDQVLNDFMLAGDQHIEQAIDFGSDVVRADYAVQGGPQIIRDGGLIDLDVHLSTSVEEYVPLDQQRGENGILPIYLSQQHQITDSRARIGFGIRPDQRCFVVLIEGCEPRTFFSEYDSVGGDAKALATCMMKLGCYEAIAFDSGGSASIVYDAKLIARVADRNDVPLAPTERITPGGWMVFC